MSVDQNINTLPTAPSRSDAPSEFSDKADAFVGALQPLPSQLNTYATQVNAAESTVEELHELAAAGAAILDATEWQSGTTYAEFDAVIGSDAQTYRSLTDANTGNDPVTDDGSNWALVGAEPVALVLKPEPVSPAPQPTTETKIVTVATGTLYQGGGATGNVFYIDGVENPSLTLTRGSTYIFDQSDASNSGHPFRIQETDGTAYTGGVTAEGTPGSAGAKTTFVVPSDAPANLEYYCTVHGIGMGGPITTEEAIASDIGETPTLDGGTYYSLYGKTHAISRFQVASDVGFNTIVYDSGEISATETHDVPSGNLLESTNYYWRVYYEDEDGVESEFSDTFEFTTSNSFLIEVPSNIQAGDAFAGGFFVGYIDTVAGTIDSQDDYQTGERYALIVSPQSIESSNTKWDSQDRTAEDGSFTRWDGLSSTNSILAKNDTSYEAFEHIRSIRSSNPVPSDGGSDWYIPAMDELEIIYRNLKPTTENNAITSLTRTFPGTQDSGFNPSSDPNGSAYTAGDPSQTTVTEFQDGGAESIASSRCWSSTDADSSGLVWRQFITSGAGEQDTLGKDNAFCGVRPVRRIPV